MPSGSDARPRTTRLCPSVPRGPGPIVSHVEPSAPAVSHSSTFLRGDIGEDARSLELLLGTIARVSHSRDSESLLDFVVDSSIEATGAERGFLVLMDERAGGQVVRVARERRSDGTAAPLGRDVKYSTSVVKRVVETDEPLKTTLQKGARSWTSATPSSTSSFAR